MFNLESAVKTFPTFPPECEIAEIEVTFGDFMQNLQILGFGNSRYDYDTFFHSEDASKIGKLPIQKISFPLVNVEYLMCDSRFEVGRLRFVSIPIKFVSFLC